MCVAKNASVEINLKCISISDVIRDRYKQLWGKITDTQCLKDLLPSKRTDRSLRQRGHDHILPRIRTERFKRCFVNRCLINFIKSHNYDLLTLFGLMFVGKFLFV